MSLGNRKLLAYTDLKSEALKEQIRFKKLGYNSRIKKEFGGYSLLKVGKKKK